MNDLETIEGEIYEVIYQNDDNGYTVCDVECNKSLVTACGHMPFIAPGEGVRLIGKWVTHPDYGEQFSVTSLEKKLPQKAASILLYLASGAVSGVRESTAKKLVAKFGEETLNIIASAPQRLAEIRGISPKRAMKISESFIMRRDAAQTVMFLQGYGISVKTALRIHKRFGNTAEELIKKNPYILCESMERIGFKTADRIAAEMGIPANNPARIASGIKYTLSEGALAGHTCLPKDMLAGRCVSSLGVSEDEVLSAYGELKRSCGIVEDDGYAYLAPFYNAEVYTAARLSEMCAHDFEYDSENTEKYIKEYSEKNGISLSDAQKSAVHCAMRSGVLIITGGPGTGKTTIMRLVLDILTEQKLAVSLCAPTGKAAKRLAESCGREAKTLHRLLGVEMSEREEQRFSRNEQNPLECDAVIVDEMSMVDILLFSALLKALRKGTRLIIAGDADQLPSVGAGNVLRDMLESAAVPSVRLSEVFRQAEESRIVVNAHRINSGEMPLANSRDKDFFFMPRSPEAALETICELCASRLASAYGYDFRNDIQVLAPSRKGIVGTINLNRVLQARLNPPSKDKKEKKFGDRIFRAGDKVIQTRNNYDMLWSTPDGKTDGLGIFNGDIGIITDIVPRDSCLIIRFDDNRIVEYDYASVEDLDIAYALTVHKSQGCEFNAVVMPVCPTAPMLMTRNLLYTAVTRAKKLAVLIGSEACIATMVKNDRVQIRYSGLAKKLREKMQNA